MWKKRFFQLLHTSMIFTTTFQTQRKKRLQSVIAGCIDILEHAWAAKLRLESNVNVCKVDKVHQELAGKIDKYCKSNSVLADALVQNSSGLPPAAEASHIEKLLAEMVLKKNAIEIKTRNKKHDGQCVNARLHLVMLETDEDIKAVFKLIGRFGESCIASLKQRFDEVAEVFKAFKLFEPEGHFEVAEETRLALVWAVSCGAEQGTFVADMRELLSAKDVVLKDNADLRLDSKRNTVWKHVF